LATPFGNQVQTSQGRPFHGNLKATGMWDALNRPGVGVPTKRDQEDIYECSNVCDGDDLLRPYVPKNPDE